MPSIIRKIADMRLEQVKNAVDALKKEANQTKPKHRVSEEERKIASNRSELLKVLTPLQKTHTNAANATRELEGHKKAQQSELTAFQGAGEELANYAKNGDAEAARSTSAKETRAARNAERAALKAEKSAKALSKAEDKIGEKQQDLFAFIIARDPIAQMSPNGDIADAVRKTKAGSNFGGLLKQFALDRVKKSSVHAIVLVNLNQAIEAYISSVARACIAEPVKTCEKLAKAEPIEYIGPDGVNHLKNLKNAVKLAYKQINDAQKDKPFMLESRTQKLLEDMGAKLGISDVLENIKTERVAGYSNKKNKL